MTKYQKRLQNKIIRIIKKQEWIKGWEIRNKLHPRFNITGKELRDEINALRTFGHRIVANTSRGYKYSYDQIETMKYCEKANARIRAAKKAINGMLIGIK